jgi:hypothetical protein
MDNYYSFIKISTFGIYISTHLFSLIIIFKAGTELVPELQPHVSNWFPSEKGILLGVAELFPV